MTSAPYYQNKTTEELLEIIASQSAQISHQAKQIQFLEEQNAAYRLRQFANKSEKSNPDQVSLFDEAELPKNPEKILAAEEEITIASYCLPVIPSAMVDVVGDYLAVRVKR